MLRQIWPCLSKVGASLLKPWDQRTLTEWLNGDRVWENRFLDENMWEKCLDFSRCWSSLTPKEIVQATLWNSQTKISKEQRYSDNAKNLQQKARKRSQINGLLYLEVLYQLDPVCLLHAKKIKKASYNSYCTDQERDLFQGNAFFRSRCT